jgi:diamine N-acetyltransferase
MNNNPLPPYSNKIALHPVGKENWRAVCALQVMDDQKTFVADPGYYLNLCHYGGLWHPLAVHLGETVIGFLMWAIDDSDGSCWLGGILIDRRYQGNGFGRQAVELALERLSKETGGTEFALSYLPSNTAARDLYLSIGFRETGEKEDEEIVARLKRKS